MSRTINPRQISTFRTTVTTSGTPVQLAANTIPEGFSFTLKAIHTNTGLISIGNSSANALNTATTNFRLQAGQSLEFQVFDTNAVWIDATVSGEGVEVVFEF